jgi:acetyl esterase/lipase
MSMKARKKMDETRLWVGQAPGQKGTQPEDTPALERVRPKGEATGAAMLICQGGGYAGLAEHEGLPVAHWLAGQGITAFVLRYRFAPRYPHPYPWIDAKRAMRVIRERASTWNLEADRVGILGFSAGGHLAASVATRYDKGDKFAADRVERKSCRPDLQVLIYPVITLGKHTDPGTRANLLGTRPDEQLVEELSLETQVNAKTPPAFLVHSVCDKVVPVENSDLYEKALKKAGVECAYLRLKQGAHGFGLHPGWTEACAAWLRARDFGLGS